MSELEQDGFYRRLAAVVVARDAVPVSVVEAARASFAWRTVDDELAALVYDSADQLVLAGVRSAGSARQLTFERAGITIEVEVGGAGRPSIVGQIVPPQPGHMEVRHLDGSVHVEVDEMGRFDVSPAPKGLMCLRFTSETGRRLATDWSRL